MLVLSPLNLGPGMEGAVEHRIAAGMQTLLQGDGKAAYNGCTCLRILQQLPRFSKASTSACCRAIQPSHCSSYLRGLEDEFAALDISIEVAEKEKTT